jgi:hypothetical protein
LRTVTLSWVADPEVEATAHGQRQLLEGKGILITRLRRSEERGVAARGLEPQRHFVEEFGE